LLARTRGVPEMKCKHEFVPVDEAGVMPYELYKLSREKRKEWMACKKCGLVIHARVIPFAIHCKSLGGFLM